LRNPSQLKQLQFHCGKPPPAPAPNTCMCMKLYDSKKFVLILFYVKKGCLTAAFLYA